VVAGSHQLVRIEVERPLAADRAVDRAAVAQHQNFLVDRWSDAEHRPAIRLEVVVGNFAVAAVADKAAAVDMVVEPVAGSLVLGPGLWGFRPET
jgi:hypothetical protein